MAMLFGFFRLGRDAELRKLQDGTSVLNMALAYNYGKKENNERPTQWVDAALFGQRAESVAQYMKKGVAISASLEDPHVVLFEKADKSTGSSIRARMANFDFATPAANGQNGQQQPTQGNNSRQQPTNTNQRQQPAPAGNQRNQPAPSNDYGFGGPDDDIPF